MLVKLLAAAVALASTDEIAYISTRGAKLLGVQLRNVGANPLDAFQITGRVHEDAADLVLLSVGADFTTPVYPCVKASGSPVALAAAAHAWMILDVNPATLNGTMPSSGRTALLRCVISLPLTSTPTMNIKFWPLPGA